jgi:hypothetical protein
MGLRKLDEVKHGSYWLVIMNPRHQDIHEGTMVRGCPAIQLVGQLARVILWPISNSSR